MALVLLYLLHTVQLQNPDGTDGVPCRTRVDAICASRIGLEKRQCYLEGDVECDVNDAESFAERNDASNAIDRLADAQKKYEHLLDVSARDDYSSIRSFLLRYTAVMIDTFHLLTYDKKIEDLQSGLRRFRQAYILWNRMLTRVPKLEDHPSIQEAKRQMIDKLVATLDKLGTKEREIAHAEQEGGRFGTARDLFEQAALHFSEAKQFRPELSTYAKLEIEARLEALFVYEPLLATLKGKNRRQTCKEYNDLLQRMRAFHDKNATLWTRQLETQEGKVVSTLSLCRLQRNVPATSIALGAAGVVMEVVAISLFADYNRACNYDVQIGSCQMIVAADAERYTRQVQASIGLAGFGAALTAAGLIVAGVGTSKIKRLQRDPLRVMPTPLSVYRGFGLSLVFRY